MVGRSACHPGGRPYRVSETARGLSVALGTNRAPAYLGSLALDGQDAEVAGAVGQVLHCPGMRGNNEAGVAAGSEAAVGDTGKAEL